MPLMELVQHHGIDTRKQRIGNQAARENAFGEESQPRARAGHLLEANLIAHRFAELFAQLVGDAARRQSRGQAARLQH